MVEGFMKKNRYSSRRNVVHSEESQETDMVFATYYYIPSLGRQGCVDSVEHVMFIETYRPIK